MKNKPSIEQHIELGKKIKQAHLLLIEAEIMACNLYGTTKFYSKFNTLDNKIAAIRCKLYGYACNEHPELPNDVVLGCYDGDNLYEVTTNLNKFRAKQLAEQIEYAATEAAAIEHYREVRREYDE
ncbi:MAG: hypothetical protein A4E23_00182 [Methanomethylovorans sp. PtaU1.Bin073]|nr:MAG: hypothetical protein A4E23_00182 [Methanomethylovorans sp. PtaU1.Bin073]